jgi:seryl-tRNA synthetase
MSVHKALSKHVNGLSQMISEFASLDQLREQLIEEACTLCKEGHSFSTDKINEVTKEMNQLAMKIENLPDRKYVSVQMIQEYVSKAH